MSFDVKQSIIANIRAAGFEPDQRLRDALRLQGGSSAADSQIFAAIYRLNGLLTRRIRFDIDSYHARPVWGNADPDTVMLKSDSERIFAPIFAKAIEFASGGPTLGTLDFVRATLEVGLKLGDDFPSRPHVIDVLTHTYADDPTIDLSKVADLKQLISELSAQLNSAEDYQYLLSLEGDRVVFRVASVLDDYIQQGSSGLYLPQRAILTHLKNSFGVCTQSEIERLEELLNSRAAKEQDFQQFFEDNPHLFRLWDYREVTPHVSLNRPEGALLPDFLLTDRELQKAAIVELKLPGPKLIRRQRNRDRFTVAVMEARAQLLRYRDWFRDAANRRSLVARVGMEVYEPRLIVIIGRSSEFEDSIDRQRLSADYKDVEVVTRDDILRSAQRRRLIIEGETCIHHP